MRLVCWLVGWWRSLGRSNAISGHDMVEIEPLQPIEVQQELVCLRCGYVLEAKVS